VALLVLNFEEVGFTAGCNNTGIHESCGRKWKWDWVCYCPLSMATCYLRLTTEYL